MAPVRGTRVARVINGVVGIVTETDGLRQICKADAACSEDIAEIVVSYP